MQPASTRANGLVDILDRVLDKGLVIAGDIKVSLAEVELLTVRIRLIVCSVDKAAEIGLDWWRHDRHLSAGPRARLGAGDRLARRIDALERRVASLSGGRRVAAGRRRPPRPGGGR